MLSVTRYGRTIRFNCFYLLIAFPCVAVVSAILMPSEKYLRNFSIEQEISKINTKCILNSHDIFAHDIDDIYTRSYHSNLISCIFHIEPDQTEVLRYLVIGSKTPLGKEIINQLKSKNIEYAEIRDFFHYDLRNNSIIRYLRSITLICIINVQNLPAEREKEFFDYCEYNKIAYITLSSNSLALVNHQYTDAMNLSYLSASESQQQNLDTKIRKYNNFYVYAGSNNTELLKVCDDAVEIMNDAIKNTENEQNSQIQVDPKRNLKNVIISSEEPPKEEKSDKIYHSHVITLTEDNLIAERFKLIVQALDRILSNYLDISFEYLVVFCPNTETRFADHFELPPNVKKFTRIIEVPPNYRKSIQLMYESVGFPEYIMRNIGIRRAKGRYITAGSADVLLPKGFFDAIRSHAFTPISYIRTTRISSPADLDTILRLSEENTAVHQAVIIPEEESNFDVQLYMDACGDFQGMHRDAWFVVHGYAESRFTYNIDSLLAFDKAALAGPIFIQHFEGGVHVEHEKISNLTQHVDPWNEELRTELAKGRLTYISRFPRRFWGSSNITFLEYKLD